MSMSSGIPYKNPDGYPDPVAFAAVLETLMHGEWKHTTLPDRWDGRTAERIVQTLINGELK